MMGEILMRCPRQRRLGVLLLVLLVINRCAAESPVHHRDSQTNNHGGVHHHHHHREDAPRRRNHRRDTPARDDQADQVAEGPVGGRGGAGSLSSHYGRGVARWVRDRLTLQFNATVTNGDGSTFAGLYPCPMQGEAYSAAYLATKETFLRHQVPEERLRGGQGNMEGASHAVFRKAALHKTVDLFDFFVTHLSWYERRLGMKGGGLRARVLQRMRAQRAHLEQPRPRRPLNDVVVVMPFYATAGGDSGHSALESRYAFLQLTLESLATVFPHVVVCVATESDAAFARDRNASNFAFFEVLTAFDVFKPSRLGLATVRRTQQKLLSDPRWAHFKYVYYTESDQIFHARDPAKLLDIASVADVPNYVIPHRIMPAPRRQDVGPEELPTGAHVAKAIEQFSRNEAKTVHRVSPDFKHVSCCFDRGTCSNNRAHWRRASSSDLHLFQIVSGGGGGAAATTTTKKAAAADFSDADSFSLVCGEGNFLKQEFRVCRLNPHRREFCDTPHVADTHLNEHW